MDLQIPSKLSDKIIVIYSYTRNIMRLLPDPNYGKMLFMDDSSVFFSLKWDPWDIL